jgi:hypothetical protein
VLGNDELVMSDTIALMITDVQDVKIDGKLVVRPGRTVAAERHECKGRSAAIAGVPVLDVVT